MRAAANADPPSVRWTPSSWRTTTSAPSMRRLRWNVPVPAVRSRSHRIRWMAGAAWRAAANVVSFTCWTVRCSTGSALGGLITQWRRAPSEERIAVQALAAAAHAATNSSVPATIVCPSGACT